MILLSFVLGIQLLRFGKKALPSICQSYLNRFDEVSNKKLRNNLPHFWKDLIIVKLKGGVMVWKLFFLRKKNGRLFQLILDMYQFKVNNRNFRTMCKICSKLTIKIPERHLKHTVKHRALFFVKRILDVMQEVGFFFSKI